MNRIWRSISGFLEGSGKSPQQPDDESAAMDGEKRMGPQFAFVALRSNRQPDEETLKAALAKWHEVPVSAVEKDEPDPEEDEEGPQVDSYDVDGIMAMITMMEVPIPSGDIDYACMNSFLWPDAADAFREQTCHLLVMSVADEDVSPAEQAIQLSRSIAAVTEAYDVLGVYWGHGCIVHKPELFRQILEEADSDMNSLPIPLWIGFLREAGENGGVNVYTSGLGAFDAMEIEVVDSRKQTMEIIQFLSGVSAYLIDKGNVIEDGNTVGGDEKQRIRARHMDSVIGREGKVLRIEF